LAAPALSILPAEEQTFGRYKLLCRFATGGMANVYLARFEGSVGFEKLVAIKRIHEHLSDNEEFIQMFVDEARLCARISHPNVAQVIELGTVGSSHFIAMEYVEGESLSALLRRTRPPLTHCARIVASAAAGLHAAHQLKDPQGRPLNVVHRDVSPQNILISYDGAVKLVDFGVARARTNLHTTTAGQVKGKFAYMAPEQISTDPHVDRRTDVFALGVVLYEITTAHRLFKGQNDAATVAKVQKLEIPFPSLVLPDYPPALENIVMKALERNPDDRFQTADELEDALEDYLVTTGTHVTRRQIGQMMRETFAERIKLKQEMMSKAESTTKVLTAPESVHQVGTDPSMSLHGRSISQARVEIDQQLEVERRQRRQNMIKLAAGVVAGLAIVVLVLYIFVSRGGDNVKPEAAASKATAPESARQPPPPGPTLTQEPAAAPAPRQIRIKIKAQPEGGQIFVDGKQVQNPYELQRVAGEGQLHVEIRGPGLVPKRFTAPLSESNSWMIELQRKRPPPPQVSGKRPPRPPAGGPRPRPRPRPRPKPEDDDLFGDPY
jgi:serine/threonine-protein kinase